MLRDDGELLQAVFDQGRDDLAAKRELRHERGWDLGAGCRHGNPVVWRAWGVLEAPIAKDQNNVRVPSALEVLPGKCVRQWIDLDGRDLAAVANHFTRDGGAVAGAGANLEEPVADSQPQRLLEQGVAVRAGD